MEFERRRQAEIEMHKRDTQEEKERLKGLHFMKCPKCGMELIEIDHRGVKVDKCSGCEGVWLDAGEPRRWRDWKIPFWIDCSASSNAERKDSS